VSRPWCDAAALAAVGSAALATVGSDALAPALS